MPKETVIKIFKSFAAMRLLFALLLAACAGGAGAAMADREFVGMILTDDATAAKIKASLQAGACANARIDDGFTARHAFVHCGNFKFKPDDISI